MADLSETIEQVAGEAKSFTADGQTAVNPDLTDLIAADKYLKNKEAAQNRKLAGIKIGRFVPPGADPR